MFDATITIETPHGARAYTFSGPEIKALEILAHGIYQAFDKSHPGDWGMTDTEWDKAENDLGEIEDHLRAIIADSGYTPLAAVHPGVAQFLQQPPPSTLTTTQPANPVPIKTVPISTLANLLNVPPAALGSDPDDDDPDPTLPAQSEVQPKPSNDQVLDELFPPKYRKR